MATSLAMATTITARGGGSANLPPQLTGDNRMLVNFWDAFGYGIAAFILGILAGMDIQRRRG